jgi:MFS family permease
VIAIEQGFHKIIDIFRNGATAFPVRDALAGIEVKKALDYVLCDGLATQVMVTLTAGIFLVAFALELGASNTIIGLLAAIPPLAELFQIPAIYIVERVRNRRFLVVLNSLLARSFWVPIAAIPFVCPQGMAIPVLIAAMCLYAVFSAVSHCGWNSWMRDLIPQDRLGDFFSRRMRLSTIFAIVLSLVAAAFIDAWKVRNPGDLASGYSVIFLAGLAAGFAGVYFLSRTPEPKMLPAEGHHFTKLLVAPVRDVNFKNLLVFLGSWNFAVNLAAPFFTVYMLTLLGLDLTWVIAFSVLSQLVSAASYRIWGFAADRFSNKSVLKVSGPLFMFCILGWTFTTLPDVHALTIPLLIVIHILIGISTAGVTLASGNISLKLAPQGRATAYLASSTVVNSLAAGIAPIIGGLCADFFAARELSLTLTWKDPVSIVAFETLDLHHWDFFFFFAFIIGLYSLFRLSRVNETGWVKEHILLQEIAAEVKREMRNLSTVGGLRMLVRFPMARIRDR